MVAPVQRPRLSDQGLVSSYSRRSRRKAAQFPIRVRPMEEPRRSIVATGSKGGGGPRRRRFGSAWHSRRALVTRTRDDATGSHAPTVEVREGAKDEASEGGSTRRHIQGPPREQHRERSPDVVPCIGCWLKVRPTLREPLDRLRQELLTVLDYPAPGNDSGRVGPGDGR